MTDNHTLDLFAPPADLLRVLERRAGVEFALGHGTFSLGGSGCIASLPGVLPGWHRLCAIYSERLDKVRDYRDVTA